MEILEKTIFKKKNEEIKKLYIQIEQRDLLIKTIVNENDNLKNEINWANDVISEQTKELDKLANKLEQKEKSRRKTVAALGGLTRYNNKLIAENTELAFKYTELKKEYEEFKKNRFVVKELKAERVPKRRQVMNVKSGAKTSRIISKIKPNEKEEIEV